MLPALKFTGQIVQEGGVTIRIDLGTDGAGAPALLDLEELLATRLLVQGNSGSGKSHLLRRLLERSAGLVQQVVIDPEGDFVTLADAFGHVAIEAADYSEPEIARIAARIRGHRASVVLSLEGLDVDAQMRCAAVFLSALFDAPRDHWYPALVVVDEAQLFAPAVAGEVSDEARRASLGAMTNLMCRGRKRGLAGVIATQRLAKLAKNVAAEASNFLMGRTFLDIDMARAADLLGMERRQAETIRDLERGHFLALGPALSRRPLPIRIGAVETAARSASPKLMPLPETSAGDMQSLLFAPAAKPPPAPPSPAHRPVPADDLIRQLEAPAPLTGIPAAANVSAPPVPEIDAEAQQAIIETALRQMIDDPDTAYRAAPLLYQDFQMRLRMLGLARCTIDLARFRRLYALAQAGLFFEAQGDPGWQAALTMAEQLPEDMLGVFLLIASAARDGRECPSDARIAEVYGTHSPGRARRALGYMESRGVIASRTDLAGKRSVALPQMGWTTAASSPDAA